VFVLPEVATVVVYEPSADDGGPSLGLKPSRRTLTPLIGVVVAMTTVLSVGLGSFDDLSKDRRRCPRRNA
jgi:hypothetical protein